MPGPQTYTGDQQLADILNRAIPPIDFGGTQTDPIIQIRDDIHSLKEEHVLGKGSIRQKETLNAGAIHQNVVDTKDMPVSTIILQAFVGDISFWFSEAVNGIPDLIVSPAYGIIILPWTGDKNVHVTVQNQGGVAASYSIILNAFSG